MALEQESEFLKEEIRSTLTQLSAHYLPSDHVRDEVRHKSLTGIVGPFGIGKTSITEEVLFRDSRFNPINTETTRGRKYGEDPEGFMTADEGVTFESFLKDVKNRNFVNFSVIPGGDAYGTKAEGFPGNYTVGPLLPDSIDQILNAGFAQETFVYLVAPGEMWRSYVEKSRRGLSPEKFQQRALESLDSITYAQDNISLFRFVESLDENGREGIEKAAQTVIDITFRQTHAILLQTRAEHYLEEMKEQAVNLAVH